MMKNKKTDEPIKLITTEDGSHSLYVPALNETYHSFHGAVQESEHVFISMGLDAFLKRNAGKKSLRILEIGLGTGLNALLVAKWGSVNNIKVEMTSLEAFPVDINLARQLNYADFLDHQDAATWFDKIHTNQWNESNAVNQWCDLHKVESKLELYLLPAGYFDVVFFDAFAPNKQSELWEIGILEKVFHSQSPEGLFVTYCAKGQLKRDLRDLGYEVETLPGPPGKKEMVRGRVK